MRKVYHCPLGYPIKVAKQFKIIGFENFKFD
jgi:hypothetical protein